MIRHSPSIISASPSSRLRGRHSNRNAVNFDTFVSDVYLPHVQLHKRSWNVDERIARQHLSPIFGDRRLDDIERCEVEKWRHGLLMRGLAPSTCNRILAVFKSIFSLAGMYGLLPVGQSPCVGVLPLKVHTMRERYLTPSEARRLMRELEQSTRPEAAAIRLLLLTGARKSEILKAKWEYVRSDLRLLIVPLSKSGKPRHIPLSDEAIAVIGSLPRRSGCPWLFPGHGAGVKPLSDIYIFGTSYAIFLALLMCVSTTCGIHSPVFWSMRGILSMRFKNFWGTAIHAPPCAILTWGRHLWWQQLKP